MPVKRHNRSDATHLVDALNAAVDAQRQEVPARVHAAARDGQVLGAHGAGHVTTGQSEGAQLDGVDPNVHLPRAITDEAHLADAVSEGRLTQAQADEMKANATERATALVNGERPDGPPPGMGPGGPGGPGGWGSGSGSSDAGSGSTSSTTAS